ncbi:TRAP transporter substrate-binding protein [Variovorax sp. N23]|uniref:TRAP transporter substrate-binding protein n=1 Tax=Variovorax sp. N23 TaxID=2980555 RepID=UPI0021C67F48|nr:TRAP transporter substrate-binding protein [Variovorax sp. N23]MCU4119696.1 TRAP transporter substrate-binding protein [Variovorax sp. N23]
MSRPRFPRLSILIAVFFAAAATAQPAVTLKIATEYPATSMPGLGMSTFVEKVAQKTGGRVVFEPSFDASAGFKSGDMVDAVQARKLDAADAFAGGVANKYPLFAVSSLPFLADSLPRAEALLKAARPAYERFLGAHGQKLLYTTPWPASGIWSKKPVGSLDALRALRIRTYDGISQSTMTAAGATAFNISFADAMPRIAAGDVDAVLSSGDGGAGRKLWQYLPAFAEINYAMPISITTINLAAYDALDAAGKAAIDQAGAETEAAQWQRIRSRLDENYRTMRSNGVVIDTRVAPDVMRGLKSASTGALKQWQAKVGADADEILKRLGSD